MARAPTSWSPRQKVLAHRKSRALLGCAVTSRKSRRALSVKVPNTCAGPGPPCTPRSRRRP
eukprot:2598924-Alexandrium_andersonii.AAC.1